MKFQDKLEKMKSIKRSELIHMAKDITSELGIIDPNEYILQVVRTFPDLIIINDLSYKESIF